MSRVQSLGEEMMAHHGFLGVPVATFEAGGRAHFIRLLENGLAPESKLLDIGCGCLRMAYWLVRFLEAGGYCGIEPARQRVEYGQRFLFTEELLAQKRPRFDFNAEFDTSVFPVRFDFFVACSIWTHCSKAHIETMLDGFQRHSGEKGVFLTSYLPASTGEEDYAGSTWVGTSHESTTPGIVRHSLAWIQEACCQRGLELTEIGDMDCDSQYWLKIAKA